MTPRERTLQAKRDAKNAHRERYGHACVICGLKTMRYPTCSTMCNNAYAHKQYEAKKAAEAARHGSAAPCATPRTSSH